MITRQPYEGEGGVDILSNYRKERVIGMVKLSHFKNEYGFINRDVTHNDILVQQRAVTRSNLQKIIRSVGQVKVVEYDVEVGEKVPEAANVAV